MYDLETIKRINRNPSKRLEPGDRRNKPAPQPTRNASLWYGVKAQLTLRAFRRDTQSPAMGREPLDE